MTVGGEPPAPARPALPSVLRHGRRSVAGPFAGSAGVHLALAGLLVALASTHPASQPRPRPIPSNIPIVIMTPMPTGQPLPKPTGDLLVRAKETPTPAPSATPTPQPSRTPLATPKPTPKPTAVPTARPSAKPTAKPTPKPTPKPAKSPTPKQLAEEKRQHKNMRKVFDYYKDMTDDQLRKQPLPPGVKSWDDMPGIAMALNLLPNFVPPPTNVTPAPDATPGASATPSASATPGARPSPLEFDEPDDVHAMLMGVKENMLTIRHKDGEAKARVTYKAIAAKPEEPGKSFEVDWTDDRDQLVDAVLKAYVEELAKNGASPSPGPSP
ncbi:MAG: hypothetical protein JWM80_2057 [Cyanobacteria bacterium RYN_339]|nr:hypothetical protein [Cyanobacteria bacterium RYN_339]